MRLKILEGKDKKEQVGSKIRRWYLANGMSRIQILGVMWLLMMTKLVCFSHFLDCTVNNSFKTTKYAHAYLICN